jgi:Domain of unknown function (DUF4331)
MQPPAKEKTAMRKLALIPLLVGAALAALLVARVAGPSAGTASSHREAPLIAEDPSADNTDLYAFRSPDKPDTVTIISNYIPGEDPAAGPNWYVFSPTARYDIYVDKDGDAKPDVTYYFQFKNGDPVAFLGNTAQTYTVTKVVDGKSTVVGEGLTTPPDNIGPRTFNGQPYRQLAAAGVHDLSDGSKVFAGQRDDGFYGDIGAIFDLVGIRIGTGATGGGKDFFAGYAVHSLALQIPIAQLDNGSNHTVGVWSAADRPKVEVKLRTVGKGKKARKVLVESKKWVQVSRLGNPLINEVIIPTQLKDKWNASDPKDDKQFEQYYTSPILAGLFNQLYPQFGPFPATNRSDLVAVLLTGLKTPALNFTGDTEADMLRLNLSIPPTAPANVKRLGVLAGDLAGWPNGRRLEDDVIDIAERAVAGTLVGHDLPLGDGVDANDVSNMTAFPYEQDPFSGFDNTKGKTFPTHP